MSRCGRCNRYLNFISRRPARLHCRTCDVTLDVPQTGTIKVLLLLLLLLFVLLLFVLLLLLPLLLVLLLLLLLLRRGVSFQQQHASPCIWLAYIVVAASMLLLHPMASLLLFCGVRTAVQGVKVSSGRLRVVAVYKSWGQGFRLLPSLL